MKAYVIQYYYGAIFVVEVFDKSGLVPVQSRTFSTEFAARTYADAINMGVIQHVEA